MKCNNEVFCILYNQTLLLFLHLLFNITRVRSELHVSTSTWIVLYNSCMCMLIILLPPSLCSWLFPSCLFFQECLFCFQIKDYRSLFFFFFFLSFLLRGSYLRMSLKTRLVKARGWRDNCQLIRMKKVKYQA